MRVEYQQCHSMKHRMLGNVPGMGNSNLGLADIVRLARKRLELNQAELGEAMGRDRTWVTQLERGKRYNGKPFTIEPHMVLKLAGVLQVDPVDLLVAAEIPEPQWPDLSQVRSNSANVRTVDITTLSPTQAKLIEQLVKELKRGNNQNESGKQPG